MHQRREPGGSAAAALTQPASGGGGRGESERVRDSLRDARSWSGGPLFEETGSRGRELTS